MIYKFPDTVLMIFCKAPIAGHVKTRLMPLLSANEAANVHIELSEKTIRMATDHHICPVQLWCAPSTDHAFFADSASTYRLQLRQQYGSDLGERMHNAFTEALANYSHALIIGCDCPSLTTSDLDIGISELNTGIEVVLAPAEDGGYVLIGLRQPLLELFENMPWGTSEVLNRTRLRIAESGRSYFELKEQWDVDTYENLQRYRKIAANPYR